MNPARNTLSKSIIVTMMVLITTVLILFLVDNKDKIHFGKPKVDFSSAQHSFIPDTVGGFIGVNKEWETATLQPIIYGFTTKNKKNYIQAAYLNDKNEEVYIDFVVSGEQNGKIVENIWLKEPFKDGMFITFDELKEKTEIGSQIRISYLKKIPTGSLSDTNFCKDLERLCNISSFDDEYRVFSIHKELLQ